MYLIVKCDELGDAWECDADRTPICITDDYSSYGNGYEVYKILADNTFEKIKDYYENLEEGIAIYHWKDDDAENELPIICEKWKDKDRKSFSKSQIKKLKAKYGFNDSVNDIFNNITYTGSHGELINGMWWVIGEYYDNYFSTGY